MFRMISVVEPLVPRDLPVPEAVLRVVVGQMLSTASAKTIHGRVCDLASYKRIEPWRLEYSDLRSCGLSNGKCRTITEFRERYVAGKADYDNWPKLSQKDLQTAIKSHWGMSDWTADILSLFYFGHEHVFPNGDGSLMRTMQAIYLKERQGNRSVDRIRPELARPFRSYLAVYLWKALDDGII